LVAAGVSDDVIEVAVVAMLTVWLTGADVLPRKLAEPRYAAVIECVPPASKETEMEALPFESVELPSVVEVEVSVKIAVPVGVPDFELTAALNVTACPKIDGFSEEVRVVLVGLWLDPPLHAAGGVTDGVQMLVS
jgi:hypothetical protein